MSDNNLGFMKSLTKNHEEGLEKQRQAEIEQDRKNREREQHNTIQIKDEDISVTLAKYCDYDCEKFGIPILPVCFSRLDYKLSAKDERFFDHTLIKKSSKHNAITSMPNRTYLYIYIENTDLWIEYYSGKDGAFNKLNVYERYALEEPDHKSKSDRYFYQEANADPDSEQPFNCSKPAHSTLATKYITINAGDINWLMMSHTKLSKGVLKKYSNDKQLRSKRMQNFVGRSLTNNVNTVEMTNRETGYIESFYRRKELSKDDGSLNSKTNMQEKTSNQVHTYSEEVRSRTVAAVSYTESYEVYGKNQIANQLYEHMNNIAMLYKRILPENKPMMIALPDPVGEVLAAAEKRNYLLKKLDDAQKDKSKIREQVNAIIIDNIRSSIESGTGYDSSVPQAPGTMGYHIIGRNEISQANNKNIYNYIDEAKFNAVLEGAKKSREDKVAIAEARQVFVDAINRSEFAEIMREDFPENDEESHLGYAQIIAEAIQGIGIDESNIGIPDAIWADYVPDQTAGMTAKKEFEQSLLPCISGEKPIEDNWLNKALIGLNPEDNQKMEDAPSFENLARASDFVGTSTSWVLAFKNRQQQNKINTAIAAQRDSINKLANHKAQILLTMSTNMAHIRDNNKLLYKLDLWSQATVYQSTGFRLAQKVLKYSPEVILNYGSQRLSQSINKAKPHSTLLPASIDTNAVGTSSSTKAPIAIDFQKTYGIDQKVIDVFDNAASGNKTALTVVTMYTNGESARATQTINQDLEQQVAQLNRDLDPISGQHRQLERQSAGKAALVSAGIGLFQLRSMWIGKSSLGAMAGRGDRYALEFMSGYASTTLALTTASLDVVNAGLQVNPARGIWVARLSLSIGLLGAVGAGFEVYSLELSQQRMKESGSTTSVDAITIAQGAAVTAGVAGFGYGTLVFLGTGAIVMPWLVGIMAVAWAISVIAQWIAHTYDKSNILPIHYWLDAGVFGNKNMIDVNEYPNNPFSKEGKSNMHTLEHDLKAYVLSMTQVTVTPVFTKKVIDFRETLSGKVEVSINQFNANSYVAVDFIKDDNDLNSDIRGYTVEELLTQNKATINEEGILKFSLDIPTVSHFQPSSGYLVTDMTGTYNAFDEDEATQAKRESQNNPSAETEKLKVMVIYELNPSTYPHYLLRTTVTSQ